MKLTPEQLRKIKMLALHPSYNTFTAQTVNLLIADLEEAQRMNANQIHRIKYLENASQTNACEAIALASELSATRKQLSELQLKLDDRNSKIFDLCGDIYSDEFPDLDAAIAEAIEPYRKDAERLDLLGKLCKETPLRPNAFCSEIAPDTRLMYDFPTLVSYDSVGNQISLRAAIDAAIAAKGEGE